MDRRKTAKAVLRLGCACIDYMILMLPTQLLMLGVMGIDSSRVDFLFRLLFAIYGVLMIEYNHGATVGKSFGHLLVVDKTGGHATMLYVGLRELIRSMYLIPVIGWFFGIISVIMMFTRGDTLHDMVGRTKVVLQSEYEREEEDDES